MSKLVLMGAATAVAFAATANAGDIVPAVGPVNVGGGIIDENVVFDNSTNLLGFLINDRDQERGDSATLAGTDRSVVRISLVIHSNAGDINSDVQVRLYDGGDSGPDPGPPLWASGVFPQMAIAAGTNQYDGSAALRKQTRQKRLDIEGVDGAVAVDVAGAGVLSVASLPVFVFSVPLRLCGFLRRAPGNGGR